MMASSDRDSPSNTSRDSVNLTRLSLPLWTIIKILQLNIKRQIWSSSHRVSLRNMNDAELQFQDEREQREHSPHHLLLCYTGLERHSGEWWMIALNTLTVSVVYLNQRRWQTAMRKMNYDRKREINEENQSKSPHTHSAHGSVVS